MWDVDLDPVRGSEQRGVRPAIIVSRDALNQSSPVIMVVPCTTHRPGRRIYSTHSVIAAGDGGLDVETVALGEQMRALDKVRFVRRRGMLSAAALADLDDALAVLLTLPRRPRGAP